MIPTLLLVGLFLAGLAGGRHGRMVAACGIIFASAAWGIGIGLSNDLGSGAAAAGLAAGNLVVGFAVGRGASRVTRPASLRPLARSTALRAPELESRSCL